MLVGEAFRRQGYAVEETGFRGADGGIDLVLRRDGRRTLVQCKQWKRRQVDAKTVREMYGLLAHQRVDSVKIVCTGGYTPDAARFAQDKPIELITGESLVDIIEAPRQTPATRVEPTLREPPKETIGTSPPCPVCGSAMVSRQNGRDGSNFLGCTLFPRCKGTRTGECTL